MNTVIEIVLYIIDTLGTLFVGAILLRFFLQLARADFYNPLSQAVVKITNPILKIFRSLIPGIKGIDFAALVAAMIVQFIIVELSVYLQHQSFASPFSALIYSIGELLMLSTYIFMIFLVIVIVASFIAPYSQHPILLLSHQLTDPVLKPLRKVIPPVGGLDFSVMFVFMGIFILQKIITGIFY